MLQLGPQEFPVMGCPLPKLSFVGGIRKQRSHAIVPAELISDSADSRHTRALSSFWFAASGTDGSANDGPDGRQSNLTRGGQRVGRETVLWPRQSTGQNFDGMSFTRRRWNGKLRNRIGDEDANFAQLVFHLAGRRRNRICAALSRSLERPERCKPDQPQYEGGPGENSPNWKRRWDS
ncbi:MAG: hypothetical protein HY735_15790 [Verrucomicrobia bacterium]|nr:hypothetical protein [Verrucomicrobiota bacterium]